MSRLASPKLTAAQRDAAASFVGVAMGIAGKIASNQPWNRDDIVSAAMLGLVRAAFKHGSIGPEKFEGYVAASVRNAITGHFQVRRNRWEFVQVGGFDNDPSRSLRPDQELELKEGVASFERDADQRKAIKADKPASPCVECGSRGGLVSRGCRTPKRTNGLCGRCYYRAYAKARRKRIKEREGAFMNSRGDWVE